MEINESQVILPVVSETEKSKCQWLLVLLFHIICLVSSASCEQEQEEEEEKGR